MMRVDRTITPPAGWRYDHDDWLWRSTKPADAARIAAAKVAHRMFTGDGSDEPSEHGKTFCCEIEEADYLDGGRREQP